MDLGNFLTSTTIFAVLNNTNHKSLVWKIQWIMEIVNFPFNYLMDFLILGKSD